MRHLSTWSYLLASVLLLTSVSIVSPVWATPPTPPAEFELAEDVQLGKLEPSEGVFALPLQFRVHDEEVGRLAVRWRVSGADPLERKPAREGEQSIDVKASNDKQRFQVDIPTMEACGRYQIELELVGRIDGGQAIVDRILLFQIIEDDGPRLISPTELRERDKSRRKANFESHLRKHPDRPDVRLLSPGTVVVPERIGKGAKPLDDRSQLQVRGDGPPPAIRRYINDREKDSWTGIDPITVRGRVVFQDFDGTWRPLVNVSVNLYDDDVFGDDHLGTTTTDWNGEWSFSVNNDDGFLQNGRDIYYQFHLGNTRWNVRDNGGDDYLWQSAVHDDLSDGSVVDFGDETGDSDQQAMQVFAVLNLGWNHITTAGGQDPGMIEARYPTSGSFFSPSTERVNIDGGDNDGPDTILHEYGHALMHKAFGGASISPGGRHGFGDDAQDEGLAYSEGWGTGYMLSVCPDGMYNWHEGNSEGAGEWPACTVQNDTGQEIELFSDVGNRIGEQNEGRVAAAINDFRDAPNDDNGGSQNRGRDGESDANSGNRISLATIYRDSMWGYVHNDFVEFWITFAGNLSGTTRSQADDIMQYNWMSVPVEVSCVASKVTVAQRKDSDSLLSGLRAFRDHGLKPMQTGRRWIQSYYSHSPEMAMLLIRDSKARAAAMEIIEHFSELGHAFNNHASLEQMLDANAAVLPEHVESAIQQVLALIDEKGSPELRRQVEPLSETIRSFRGLSLAQAFDVVNTMAPAEKGGAMNVVHPQKLAPASRKADWELIREYMAPVKDIRELPGSVDTRQRSWQRME